MIWNWLELKKVSSISHHSTFVSCQSFFLIYYSRHRTPVLGFHCLWKRFPPLFLKISFSYFSYISSLLNKGRFINFKTSNLLHCKVREICVPASLRSWILFCIQCEKSNWWLFRVRFSLFYRSQNTIQRINDISLCFYIPLLISAINGRLYE